MYPVSSHRLEFQLTSHVSLVMGEKNIKMIINTVHTFAYFLVQKHLGLIEIYPKINLLKNFTWKLEKKTR